MELTERESKVFNQIAALCSENNGVLLVRSYLDAPEGITRNSLKNLSRLGLLSINTEYVGTKLFIHIQVTDRGKTFII